MLVAVFKNLSQGFQATDMDLTLDGQAVGVHGILASDSVGRLACVLSGVLGSRHLDRKLGRFDTGICAVKLPG